MKTLFGAIFDVIAIDTNVLLRYLLADDNRQSPLAASLIKGNQRVLITDIVLVETIWTLQGKKYQLVKADLLSVILALFKEPNIRFENSQIIWQAYSNWRQSKPVKGKDADFSDALIAAKAQYRIEQQQEPFGGVYTFDRAAQTLPGMKAPI